MDRFSKFHPLVSFSFFMLEIILTVVYINPVFAGCSLAFAAFYYTMLEGSKAFALIFKTAFPLTAAVGIFNMLFCRYGDTVLFSVKSLSFTFEPLAYGLTMGVMLSAVIIWFLAYCLVIDSEKFTAVFGRIAPNLSLLFLMVLRFVPLMRKTSKEIYDAQTGLGNETKGVKNTIKRFSALVSISLERSIETADTMRALGYSSRKRKHFSRFSFNVKDAFALAFIVSLFCACAAFRLWGAFNFVYSPSLKIENFSIADLVIFAAFSLFPTVIDLKEEIKWIFLRSKI